jgi:hypothetical protein
MAKNDMESYAKARNAKLKPDQKKAETSKPLPKSSPSVKPDLKKTLKNETKKAPVKGKKKSKKKTPMTMAEAMGKKM